MFSDPMDGLLCVYMRKNFVKMVLKVLQEVSLDECQAGIEVYVDFKNTLERKSN